MLLLFAASPVFAQDTADEERSYFLRFVENQLSTPNRQIRINGIQGALSSNARIGEITVADRDGVWLRIENASIVWSRLALLRGRLAIDTLSAEAIEVARKPLPDESLPSPESRSFSLPELPVAVVLDALEVERVSFGETVFGLESVLAVTGRIRLESGSLDSELDSELDLTRLDGPGGRLHLAASFANETEQLDIDLALSEPEDGVVANLLNIEGRPPIDLAASGSGPLSAFDLTTTLDAAGERVLSGQTGLRRQNEGLAFTSRLEGSVARLVAPVYRDFFGAETGIEAAGLVKDAGGIRLDNLDLTSAALALNASAETGSDGFLRRLALDARIANADGSRVLLPVPGATTTLDQGRMEIAYGDATDETWSATVDLAGLQTGGLAAEQTVLELGGLARNLDRPTVREITFAADGDISGITAERADVAQALGEAVELDVEGSWRAGSPVEIARAVLSGKALRLSTQGNFADLAYRGRIGLETASLAPFSALAGRDLSGALDLSANGELRPLTGAFDLTLDGTADELRIDNEAADNLLAGATTIVGRAARGEEGLTADGLRIGNDQVTLAADGTFATGAADFDLDFTLSDLALLSPQAEGRLTASGTAKGGDGLINLTFQASVPGGNLAGKRLGEAHFGFDGTLQDNVLDGQLAGSAFLDGVLAELSAAVALAEDEKRVGDLRFAAGGARLTGNVTQDASGLFSGSLAVDAADISTAAALFLADARGAIQAQIELAAQDNRQHADISADIERFELGDTRIDAADLAVAIDDLLGVPAAQGTARASGVVAGGVTIDRMEAEARRSGTQTDFTLDAGLANGATVGATGALAPEGEGFRLSLSRTDLAQGELAARLSRPASLLVEGQTVTIEDLALAVGSGHVAAAGTIAEALDMNVTIRDLPLALANAIRPDLELGGTLNGSARIAGTRDAPEITFDLSGRSLTAAALRAAGLDQVSIDARGTTSGGMMNVDASLTGPRGFRASANGAVPLGDGRLDLDARLESFPLALLNRAVPGQNLAGNVTGSARIGGTLADPEATFQLSGTGLSAATLQEFGAAPLSAEARGRFAGNALTLETGRVDGPAGLEITASGTAPLSGAGLRMSARGNVPLALANRLLAERGAQASGTVTFDLTATGSLNRPQLAGSISASGAQIVDPQSNLRLNDIALSARLERETVTIASLTAASASGGTINASGTISTNSQAGFPANIRIGLNQARYADGHMVVATVSGEITITGALARDPLIGGALTVERAEISVPSNFGGGAAALDVRHINPSPGVKATLRRAQAEDGTPMPSARPSIARLDMTIDAPGRIFVRGRGLDAELGGQVRLTGPVSDIQPVGGFELIRGRLAIIGQRITFDEGTVTLVGDLDPFLNFIARAERSGIDVFITVRGRVSDLNIGFSSQPELPEDEVLARLIFNRGLDELSAVQIAQLAAAAAELAGGSNTSLLQNLRGATGLDELDVVTDEEGGAGVRAGRYIQDNIYLGVEAGTSGTTRGTINLDITKDLKARGSVASDGDTGVGLFFERDY
uniref:translocation/assembly module TamB domain-containing protein n=1 Tax=Mesorhizobium xinjiangense TaxID=2678685 RepID=UPI0038B2F539